MINLRVLSTAAAIALLLPMAAPSASFAQNQKVQGGARVGGGGGAPVARFNGGGGAPVARFNSGGSAPTARFNAGVNTAPVARFNGGSTAGPVVGSGGAPQARFSDGRSGWRDGDRHHRGGGFGPGFAAGAIIGGAAIASQSYGYYGGPGYYAPGYYDDQYYDAAPVAVVPGGDDAVAWCMQTYRSYDPASGTYLGYDGLRHPCP